jgi:hypothetical protein
MRLITPGDLSVFEKARQINAENAKAWAEGSKPRAGSSKAKAATMPKPKTPVNLARQVREEEQVMKTGKRGKARDVAVSCFRYFFLFRLF